MTLSRRNVLKLGLGAGAISLLDSVPVPASALPAERTDGPRKPILAARRLPLEGVRLLGGPLKQAQDADIRYLLQLEPDRMLAYYRERAGLAPKAKPYGGWDGDGRNLTGHIAGHHLSAIQLTTAGAICTMVDLLLEGKLPKRGFVRQEQTKLDDFLENRFGCFYAM